MTAPSSKPLITKARAAGRGAFAVLLAAAVFVGVVQVNRQYAYCTATKQVMSVGCCPQQSSKQASDEIAAATCCELHSLPALEPSAPSPRAGDSIQAPIAYLTAIALRDLAPPAISTARPHDDARPAPLPASRARARLMIFLL